MMFLGHFEFTSQPFEERTAAEALWQDERMQQGLARLRYLSEHATMGLITGTTGVGKSALLKRFLHELSGPQFEPVYLHLTHFSSYGLLSLLVRKLGEVPRNTKDQLFEQILHKAREVEGTLLVILDEAHLIKTETLTDLRLLVSSALDERPPLKIVLVGQEPLRQTLKRSVLADLLGRISVRFHLSPLSKEQTAAYIDFQLQQAGSSPKLFESAAKALIHDYSGGIPRQINNLSTACLLQAAAQNTPRISEAILRQTLSEFQLP